MTAPDEWSPVLPFTQRQRRLLWEVVTMVDPDTLLDNLATVNELPHSEPGEMHQDICKELDGLSELLDPDGVFRDEWMALGAPMDGTGSHP